MLHDVVVVWSGSCNNVAPGHAQLFNFQLATCRNSLQQGGQTHATCCAQQCCDLLRLNVAIVWPKLANNGLTMLGYVALRCCYRLAGALLARCTQPKRFSRNYLRRNDGNIILYVLVSFHTRDVFCTRTLLFVWPDFRLFFCLFGCSLVCRLFGLGS